MCDSCWREAGSPTERTSDTDRLVQLHHDLYAIHPTGGPLHVVLDDWNLHGTITPWYDGYDDEELDELWSDGWRIDVEGLGRSMRSLCDEIAAILNAMTEPQRYAAVAHADGLIATDGDSLRS